ncbi:MAG: restriction endonuclease subunit S [Sedimentibacter sp.]|uniref:restriction endonuclease subunit S n=1 Tax=Sedimentibacter sp. TaxID=1960295 RepID=UPI0029826711|nr:restriction endonuclease subunit S [Sedimentibacter sp.]MDW5300487.1 restriction endonuclease subunit S [Sedimentibacter sp.]
MLNTREWKEFFLTDIFLQIQRGKRLTKSKQINGTIPYVSSTSFNNGVDNFISNKKNVRKFSDCLSIANSGSVGSSFYQPFEFIASDHITHLKNDKMNKYIYLFIATMTNRFSEKYNFNREINDNRISRETIMLPIDKNNKPDWQFMEDYMIELEESKRADYLTFVENKLKNLKFKEIENLEIKEWKEFSISELFTVKIGTSIDGNKIDKNSGETPYITRKETNNGLDGFIEDEEIKMTKNYPVITIGNETAQPFVQQYPFYTGTKVNVLKPIKDLSENILFFISTCLRQQKSKYSYSFTINSTRLKKQTILLPINHKDEPDYEYMEQYIKNLMFKKYNQYLNYNK